MKHTQLKKRNTSPRLVCYVRLTPQEHDKLVKDVLKAGKSAPALLKRAYFEKNPMIILMADPDRDHFIAQINRIGNNVNQIARHLNSGFAFGFQNELETIRAQLTILITWITARYRGFKL